MTGPQDARTRYAGYGYYSGTPHDPEPTPNNDATIAAVASLLLLGAASTVTADAILHVLPARRPPYSRDALRIMLDLTARTTAHRPRMIGRSDVARAQQATEAHYRAAYVVRAAERVGDAVQAAADAGSSTRDALAEAVRAERRHEAAHQEARRRRMDAALLVADAADRYGPLLGWYTVRDGHETPECRAADGSNFRAGMPPIIGFPGTLHGGACRCEPGPPFDHAPSTDQATRMGPG